MAKTNKEKNMKSMILHGPILRKLGGYQAQPSPGQERQDYVDANQK